MSRRRHSRTGVSLLEVIVVLAVIGVLFSLILPAIQSSRETSQRMSCAHNLHEIGVGLFSAEESSGSLPASSDCLVQLLPHLGLASEYDAVTSLPPLRGPDPPIALFRCPSDSVLNTTFGFPTNYQINLGTAFPDVANGMKLNGFRIAGTGYKGTRFRDITDGSSHTAAFSERLLTDEIAMTLPAATLAAEPRRYAWHTQLRFSSQGEEGLAVEQCQQHRTYPSPASIIQIQYVNMHDGYQHLLTPNQRACFNGPSRSFGLENNLVSPSSLHTGGVNTLFADGSVHFVDNSIDIRVWRALGSRDEGETEAVF